MYIKNAMQLTFQNHIKFSDFLQLQNFTFKITMKKNNFIKKITFLLQILCYFLCKNKKKS